MRRLMNCKLRVQATQVYLMRAKKKGMTNCWQSHLLVDPLVDGARVRDRGVLLAEPEGNLSLGRLRRV